MPYGRGGAGNFYQSEADKKRVAEDIEAALPPSSSSSTSTSSQQAQEYAHMGRGGAGNWFSPRDLQQTGQFTSTDAAAALKTGLKSPASSPTSPVSPPGLPPNYPGASASATHTPIHTDASQQQPRQQQLPTARLGRGGAGNMVWDDGQTMDERKRKEREDEEKREVLSEKVKQDVEAGLKRPGRAVLGEDVGVNGVKGWKF